MQFGDRLKDLRTEKGLTQTELANIIGLKKTTISNYETGFSFPDYKTLIKLADFFKVSTDYLLGREGVHKPMTSQELEILKEQIKKELVEEMQSKKQAKNFWWEEIKKKTLKKTTSLGLPEQYQVIAAISTVVRYSLGAERLDKLPNEQITKAKNIAEKILSIFDENQRKEKEKK
ncbi:MAG: helix-turn-helix transcriptional regulator [Clostridia bacterium]|nr:helix-turn-helix transcriptional regulator [Clostridia bacterium]